MRFRRKTQEEVSLNLTSLIDVVFLLLIFFMVSTTFTKETQLAIVLPEADGEPRENPEAKWIEVVISRDGTFAVDGRVLINTQARTLKNALLKVSDGNSAVPLIIKADAKTPYQSVVTAMDVAGQIGFSNLSMTTRHSEESNR